MEIKVSVEIKGTLLKRMMAAPEELSSAMRRAGMVHLVSEIEARAVKEAPVRTSNLVNSITSTVSPDGKKGEIRATAPYARYVHEGTGIFGPLKRPIKPVTKKALFWPGALHPVKSVKGMKGNPFMTRAVKNTRAGEAFEAGVGTFLKSMA